MKKILSFLLCLVAVSLSACKKHAPVASKETCSNEYLEKHPDLQKFFESDGKALVNFEQSCALVEQMEAAKREKALKALMVTARTLTTGETCSEGYVKNHPEFLKDHLQISKSDSDLLDADDVKYTFSKACYDFKNIREEKIKQSLLKSARAIATEKTCIGAFGDRYIKDHPEFLKKNLPVDKDDTALFGSNNMYSNIDWYLKSAFRQACQDFNAGPEDKRLTEEARAVVKKEMCSIDYLQKHPEVLRSHPRLARRIDGRESTAPMFNTYFGEACAHLGVNNFGDWWVDTQNLNDSLVVKYADNPG